MDIDTPLIEGNCWVHIPILKNYGVQKRLGESYWIIVIPILHIRTTINTHYKEIISLNEYRGQHYCNANIFLQCM